MQVDIFRSEHGRYYQIINHHIPMEITVHQEGRITRMVDYSFGVCGNDPFTDWEDFEQGTGIPREQIIEEFKLAEKEY